MQFLSKDLCDPAYNKFRDELSETRKAFVNEADEQMGGMPFTAIFDKIEYYLIQNNHDLPFEDVRHPIRQFGNPLDSYENTNRLAERLLAEFQSQRHRVAIMALFHSMGVYRADLDELMEAFWTYADVCYGIDLEAIDPNEEYNQGEYDDDDESEDEEEEEDNPNLHDS
jgi:hypothetical protein